jgi:hypothetical protein
MIYNKEYFAKGEVAGGLVVEEKDYAGNLISTHTFTAEAKGEFVLTLAWNGVRESKRFDNFATAMRMANGYWARQAIWHITAEGKRKRVVCWQ